MNGRPVYRRQLDGEDCFLWYRGGNWGVTAQLHASSHAAPFLARCADTSGRSRHPLEVRRPRWHVRTGRGREEMDPGVYLEEGRGREGTAAAPSRPAKAVMQDSCGSASTAAVLDTQTSEAAVPSAVVLSGRCGTHEQVNGRYELGSGLNQ